MKKKFSIALLTFVMLATAAALATDIKFKQKVITTKDVTVGGNLAVTGTTSFTGAVTPPFGLAINDTAENNTISIITGSDEAGNRTVTFPALGGNKTFALIEGGQTFNPALTKASVNNAVKRKFFVAQVSPNTGAAADSTIYRAMIFPGVAGTVKSVTIGCQLPPTVGTDVVKVLKAGSSGNTMLDAATFDANTLVANTATASGLTATAPDLALTAAQGVYIEYNAGSQTQDAIGVTVTIGFESDDF